MQEPVISIVCNTYNQEKYLRDALESFIEQQVCVPFEVLVHDDASSDGTVAVLREYASKYPTLIFPLCQRENQYSQNIKITPEIQLPRARGKYIAFCEGDDYWTSSHKLQLQYDFLEAHPEYSGCCHAYTMVTRYRQPIQVKKLYRNDSPIDIACLIGNQLEAPHFATMLLRRDALEGLGREFLGKPCNDMAIRLYCAAKAPLYYFSQNMSAYRRFTEGSWTMRVGKDQTALMRDHQLNIQFLRRYDDYTGRKYTQAIQKSIDWREFEIALVQGDYDGALQKNAYRNASLKRRIYIRLGRCFPRLVHYFRTR